MPIRIRGPLAGLSVAASLAWTSAGFAQSVAVDGSVQYQTIDGFGTMSGSDEAQQTWWQNLFFDDLQASIYRVDIEPTFTSQYSNLSYCSPWFGQPAPLTLDNGSNGPDGTRTRQYTSAADYSNTFGGCSAPIAVMGPNIDDNVKLYDFTTAQATQGMVAQLGSSKSASLGGFKLYGSMFSPAPWVKVSSGNTYAGGASPLPTAVPWPFIWGGNFAGGRLDVSDTPISQFNDGTGPTSALTQFARGLAAFLRGFQNAFHTTFYAISLQNELNFEEFYSSATYPLASEYVTALKAARAELDQYPDLAPIKIIGPEDLMGGDPYSMWEYGSGSSATAKNLNYLAAVAADSAAASALAGFAIHAYLENGSTSAGADSQSWAWWANGWTTSPAAGLPGTVAGFESYGKPSWMTETSGEVPEWLASSTDGGLPDSGAFSIALKLHQALTTGDEQAWIYLRLTDGNPADDTHVFTLTDSKQLANCPKYVAAKHFFRYIRPGAKRVQANVTGSTSLLATAYLDAAAAALTIVLVNASASAVTAPLSLAHAPAGLTSFSAFTSSNGSLWQPSMVPASSGSIHVDVPAYGVVTLYGTGAAAGDAGAVADGGPGAGGDGGSSDGGVPAGDAAGSADGGPDNGDTGGTGKSSGCGCTTAGEAPGWPAAWVLTLCFAAAIRARCRRRSGIDQEHAERFGDVEVGLGRARGAPGEELA